MATEITFASVIRSPQIKFVNADGTSTKTLFTAGTGGAIVRSIWATSNNDADIFVTLIKSDGAIDSLVDSINIPAATTITPVQRINFFDPSRLTQLNPYDIAWHIAANHIFKVKIDTTVSAGSYEVSVFAEYGEP
jgi:hypothetical protein